jgi:hypothetical protein
MGQVNFQGDEKADLVKVTRSPPSSLMTLRCTTLRRLMGLDSKELRGPWEGWVYIALAQRQAAPHGASGLGISGSSWSYAALLWREVTGCNNSNVFIINICHLKFIIY